MLTAVLGKVHHWHWTKEILWEISFLQHCLKKILVCRRLYLYWTHPYSRSITKWQRIENSWKIEVLFVKIGVRVLDLWLDTSSWPKWPKCSFYAPEPQDQEFFWDFIIVLDSSRDSWENEVLFVKIGTRDMDLWLDTSSGLSWPKCSF